MLATACRGASVRNTADIAQINATALAGLDAAHALRVHVGRHSRHISGLLSMSGALNVSTMNNARRLDNVEFNILSNSRQTQLINASRAQQRRLDNIESATQSNRRGLQSLEAGRRTSLVRFGQIQSELQRHSTAIAAITRFRHAYSNNQTANIGSLRNTLVGLEEFHARQLRTNERIINQIHGVSNLTTTGLEKYTLLNSTASRLNIQFGRLAAEGQAIQSQYRAVSSQHALLKLDTTQVNTTATNNLYSTQRLQSQYRMIASENVELKGKVQTMNATIGSTITELRAAVQTISSLEEQIRSLNRRCPQDGNRRLSGCGGSIQQQRSGETGAIETDAGMHFEASDAVTNWAIRSLVITVVAVSM